MLIIAALELIITLVTAIIDLLPMIIDAAIEIVLALNMGLISMLPEIIEAGIELIIALVEAILEMQPQLYDAAVDLIIALIEGALSLLSQIVEMAMEVGTSILDTIINMDWLGLGIDLVQGLINGMLGMVGNVISAAADLANSVWDTFTGIFQTNSPSRLMMGLGDDIGMGLQIGMDDSAMAVAESASRMASAAYPDVHYIDDYRDTAPSSGGGSTTVYNQQNYNLELKFDQPPRNASEEYHLEQAIKKALKDDKDKRDATAV
ncbi:hypothetical protein [Geomicrobium sp. JCM 19055]|uniref:phage tail protein n=1 Tax=Geomicrobium sp. JCM 19055 TaxID=1460649 RepID=UPI0012688BD4|nr:hypothetical protein [Geomicrobium sp. JCM 19055]